MSEKRSNLIDVGRVAGAFGVKGWLKVVSDTEPAKNIFSYSPWWLKTQHGVKAFEVIDNRQTANGLLVHLKGINDRDLAMQYSNTKIAVQKSQLAVLDAGDYYWHQLIGLEVVSEFDGQTFYLGRVKELLETGANDVLVVAPADEASACLQLPDKPHTAEQKERLIPYLPEIYVLSVDLAQQVMRVNWDPDF